MTSYLFLKHYFSSKHILDANDDISFKLLNKMFRNMEKFLAQLMQ